MNRLHAGFFILFVLLIVGCGDKSSYDDPQAAKRAAVRQLVGAAAKEAAHISKAEEKAAAYLSLATARVAIGDTAAARQNVKSATATIVGITGDTSNGFSPLTRLYTRLARVQADVGDVKGAKATVKKIRDGWSKAEAYAQIAGSQLKMKDVTGARQTLTAAKNEVENNKATYYLNFGTICSHIADVWAEAGDIAGAKTFVEIMPDDPLSKALSYQLIAVAQAKAGDVDGAYQTVELAKAVTARIRVEQARIFPDLCIQNTYTEIAQVQAEAGDEAGAKATLARLQDMVRKDTAGQSKAIADLAQDSVFASQVFVCLEIAASQAKAGNIAEARRNIEAAKAAAKISDQNSATYSYLAISQSLRDIGDVDAARKTINLAKAAVEKFDHKTTSEDRNHRKIWGYCSIMAAQAKAGDDAGAGETLETMRSLISKFSPEYSGFKSWAYRAIAEAQAATGNIAGAKAAATQIQSESDKERAYRGIVELQAEAGDAAGAIEYCTQMLTEPSKRCKCLTDAAMRLCPEP